jgi:hypothetical protein
MRLSAIALTFLLLAAPALARTSQPTVAFDTPDPFARLLKDLFGPDPAIQPRPARNATPRRHSRKPAAKAVLKSPPATNPTCSNMRYAADFLPHRLTTLPTGRLKRTRASVFAVTGTVGAQEFLAITYINPNTGAVSVHALDAHGHFMSCPPFRSPPEAPLFLAHAKLLLDDPAFAIAEQRHAGLSAPGLQRLRDAVEIAINRLPPPRPQRQAPGTKTHAVPASSKHN